MKSRRVVINDKEDVAIEEVELGELQPGQIRIRTEYSLISAGTELSRVFKLKEGAKYPAYPGYCSTGIVLQSNIEGFREGDHVLFSGPHADLHNFDPLHSDGSILYRLDPSTDMKKAPYMVMCWIALNGILPADVKIGDTVAVFGLGTLGILVSLYYQMAGCRVIGFEPSESRARLAERAGVREVISCPAEEQLDRFAQLDLPDGVDISVDAAGVSACIEKAIQITGANGQVVLLGSPRQPYQTNASQSFYAIHSKMLKVIGALNRKYSFEPQPGSRVSMKRYLGYIEKLINEDQLPVEMFISHQIEPDAEQLLEAYRGLMYDKDHYTGVIIKW
ncbi:MAG: zinc-binding alcohol dehydrogenase [Erysipelotrichaceae bacterium]|nr:zinc-binding alcohol dehydrogenase [Erysipelotrichaceae bacterium]